MSYGDDELGSWRFDEGVAEILDNMMERSIPGYDDMRDAINRLVWAYAEHHYEIADPLILDVGCATGQAYENLRFSLRRCRYYGIDSSADMIRYCNRKWGMHLNKRYRHLFVCHDIVSDGPSLEDMGIEEMDVVLCVLTLHFIPESRRVEALEKIRAAMKLGAMLIVVDKVRPQRHPSWDGVFRAAHHLYKSRVGGYSEKEIEAKEEALSGVLVPWTTSANREAFIAARFSEPEIFWANSCFVGWAMLNEPPGFTEA